MTTFEKAASFTVGNVFVDSESLIGDPDVTMTIGNRMGATTTEAKAYRVILMDVVPLADVELILVAEGA